MDTVSQWQTLAARLRDIRDLEAIVGTKSRARFLKQYIAAASGLQAQIALASAYINHLKEESINDTTE